MIFFKKGTLLVKLCVASILFTFALKTNEVFSQEVQESKIQAAMLMTMLKYIEWPDERNADEFVVGVFGSEDVYETLKSGYEGKLKGSKKYTIKKVNTISEATSCFVVFVGKDKVRDFESLKGAIGNKSILTVTNKDEMGRRGSGINFILVDGKLKFELNRNILSASNLKISSALTAMAILI